MKWMTSKYQQRLMVKPKVPRSSFGRASFGRDGDANPSSFSRLSSSTWFLALCEGLSKPLQTQVGLHLPSRSLRVRGEVHGRDSTPIHKIPSPRSLNGLDNLWTGAYAPTSFRTVAAAWGNLGQRPSALVSPTIIHAHVHGNSKPSVIEVISVWFLRSPNTTVLPSARMTCCAGCHILSHDWNLRWYEKVIILLQEELSNTELRTQPDLIKQEDYCDEQFQDPTSKNEWIEVTPNENKNKGLQLKFVTTNPIRDQVWAELLTNIKEERETWSISNKKKGTSNIGNHEKKIKTQWKV